MPIQSQPRLAEVFATARMTAFKPGQSPPPVTTPIRLLILLPLSLRGQPGRAVRPDERDAFVNCVDAMRNGKIDLAGEFVTFLEHRATTPFNELDPHFPYENQRCVIELADLEKLPC